MTFDIITNQTE